MSDSTTLGRHVQSLDIGNELPSYVGVLAHVMTDEDNTERVLWAGARPTYEEAFGTGLIMEFTNPLATQAMVDNLWADLNKKNFRYQPFTAEGALLDPAAEMGDAVSVSDVYSAIFHRDITYSALMAHTVSAPADEEIDHEFPYVSQSERQYKREKSYARTMISQNADAISLEASTARENEAAIRSTLNITAGEIRSEISESNNQLREEFNSSISQTSREIRADVVAKEDGSRTSFGWSLKSTGWEVYSGNQTILKATSSGLEVTGKITATSGKIGGFDIGSTAITYKGQTWGGTVNDGIYIGQSGIQLGPRFSVTNKGNVTAKAITISGGSINMTNDNNETMFQVTNKGVLTAKRGTIAGFSLAETSLEKATATPTDYSSQQTQYGFKLNTPAKPAGGSTALSIWKTVYTPNSRKTGWASTVNSDILKIQYNGKITSIGAVSLANGNFTVDADGNVVANNLNLKGTLKIYDENYDTNQKTYNITADKLRQGSVAGYDWSNGSYGGENSRAAYALSGAGYGYGYNNACDWEADGPQVFSCQNLRINHVTYRGSVDITVGGHTYTVLGWKEN